jgi:hypothetical protein
MTSLNRKADLELKEKTKKHRTQSVHYFKNALRYIEMGDSEKASELLWGSMSQALKAVAANRGMRLKSHKDIRNYAMEVTRAMRDDSIWHAFTTAQSLHSNFYETGLMLEDVAVGAKEIKEAIGTLFSFIPKEN